MKRLNWLATAVAVVALLGLLQLRTPAQPLTLETAGLALEDLGDGVYGLIASTDFPPQDFATDAICNGAIVIGSDGVLVVDPFQNEALAQLLFDTAAELSDQPVRYVLNTHYHFDHTGGNAAVAALDASLVGRGPIREFMARNAEMDDNVTPPDLIVNSGDLWLGERQVQLLAVEGHSGGTDVIAYVPDADVLVAGDLLFNQRIPYVSDGSIRTWIQELEMLTETYPTATMLPGHGAVGGVSLLSAQQEYLETLEALALGWQEAGLSEEAAMETVVPEAYADYLFQGLFPTNLETAYQQITLGEDDAASIQRHAQAQPLALQAL